MKLGSQHRNSACERVPVAQHLKGLSFGFLAPIGTAHRLENPGKIPLHLIEVQSGSYLGEDDIIRLEDSYGRS